VSPPPDDGSPVVIAAPCLVRPASPADASRISAAHAASITSLMPARYEPELVAAYARQCVPGKYLAWFDRGVRVFLAQADAASTEVLGFSTYGLEDGKHRTGVFVVGGAARRGVGGALFRAAEAAARAEGAPEVMVDAALNAVGFYRAMGFSETGRGSHRIAGSDLFLDCVHMTKVLTATG